MGITVADSDVPFGCIPIVVRPVTAVHGIFILPRRRFVTQFTVSIRPAPAAIDGASYAGYLAARLMWINPRRAGAPGRRQGSATPAH